MRRWFRSFCAALVLSSIGVMAQPCGARNGEGPITAKDNAGVEEGIRSADEAPIVALTPAPQTFSFESHKFTIHAEAPLKLQVSDHGNSRTFAFLGPERKNLGQSVFSIIVINGGAAEHVPNKDELMQGMLHPFRQRLSDYKEVPFILELSGGKRESGTEFSGTLGGSYKLHGFVVNVPIKDGIYCLTTTEREEMYGQSLIKLQSLAKTIKIEK